MTAVARAFAVLFWFAIGVAVIALADNQPSWLPGAAIAASVAAICWGLAVAVTEPDDEQPRSVIWQSPTLGTEHVITAGPTPRDGWPRICDSDFRPVWPHDIGAPE